MFSHIYLRLGCLTFQRYCAVEGRGSRFAKGYVFLFANRMMMKARMAFTRVSHTRLTRGVGQFDMKLHRTAQVWSAQVKSDEKPEET